MPTPGAAERTEEKSVGRYDKNRAARVLAHPVISNENIESVKAPIRAVVQKAKNFAGGVREAGRSFARASRYNMARLRGGRR